ncbi:membrane protein insertase YidC [Saccharibacter sp. 17.LH.SD]|uniref:membrane protein insertase YidC n=1 Tax=Saccharibacter sp. 17.LH.SD TaxID=2689393 RepID=UPI0013690514|nr:membrane protein insertase YidC [Saccharibacter sp. 17.LH.SD]MXV44106.1 membrane protein insertase YidC [Saccharibacter sp. 17.LH.SD]
MESSKRTLLAIVISAIVLVGFNYFYPKPQDHQAAPAQSSSVAQATSSNHVPLPPSQKAAAEAVQSVPDRRITIAGKDVRGTFNLHGARFDDLVLTQYRETLAKDSPLVRLLEQAGSQSPSYVVVGWQNMPGYATVLPDQNSLWESDGGELSLEHPVTLQWNNGAGVTFRIRLTLDEHYMFGIDQEIDNQSGQPISVYPFQRVQRDYLPADTGSFTAYEGPIAVMNGKLADNGYKSLRKGSDQPDHVSWQATGLGGWGGITDKYWLTAIGADPAQAVTVRYAYVPQGDAGSYQITFSRRDPQIIQNGATLGYTSHLFAGAKVTSLLHYYDKKFGLTSFDKAIDFGWFGFLTRPILYLLHWLYVHIGNFGLALMALTLIVKIVLFPLAYKATVSSARMRMVAPKIAEIREKYKDDPMGMNQRVMGLYKEEKINPAGGCLPVLIQAPIFFCLYKMLNLSIDERHAPFFGWIKDLSVPDPTNLLNLFGLIPFDPTHIASFLHLSIWGAALGITFWILQRESMVSMDPAQARIMRFMPLVYVFVMSSFPAGLLVYYTWNNLLTFLQQIYIQRHTRLPKPLKK